MKKEISKTEAQKKIEEFFQRNDFSAEEMGKIKRLAMKFKIRLGNYRKFFCKKCLSKLRGKIRITKTYKIVACGKCGFKNKIRLQ